MSNREDRPELQRDAALERVWRAASTEQPSARLDTAILAAAHEAVAGLRAAESTLTTRGSARSRWIRWAPIAVAASVAGLALTLVQILPREPGGTPAPSAREPAPTLAPAQDSSAERQQKAAQHASDRDHASALPAAPAPALSTERSMAADAAPTEGVVHVDEWVQRIVALHGAGDVAAAADALRAFRAAEPGADRHLPESLWEWARSVQ